MKIVHLTDTYAPVVGGIERQIERLAGLQAASGHDVTVVSGRAVPGPAIRRENGVMVRRPARPTHPVRALPLHVDDMDADVFHAHVSVLSPGTTRACMLLRAAGLPLAVTVHSVWPSWPTPARTVVQLAALDSAGVAWSAVSRVAAARVQACLAPGGRVDVVPNAVDTDWWTNPSPVDPGARTTAVLVGRLAHRKRVLPFLRSLAADWPTTLDVTVVGDGPQSRAITRLAHREGLDARLRMLGALTPRGVREILHHADVFVAPSRLESFGIAALEARSAGLPVLARQGTGVSDFIEDGLDGWFADSDATLADGLRALVAAPTRFRALQRSARGSRPRIDQVVASTAAYRLYDRAVTPREAAQTNTRDGVTPVAAAASASWAAAPAASGRPVR